MYVDPSQHAADIDPSQHAGDIDPSQHDGDIDPSEQAAVASRMSAECAAAAPGPYNESPTFDMSDDYNTTELIDVPWNVTLKGGECTLRGPLECDIEGGECTVSGGTSQLQQHHNVICAPTCMCCVDIHRSELLTTVQNHKRTLVLFTPPIA